MNNNTDSINRLAGASISNQPVLVDTVGPQPARRYRPYGAEIKNSNTKAHGAMTTMAQSRTGYSSLSDKTAFRCEAQKLELMMSSSVAQGSAVYCCFDGL